MARTRAGARKAPAYQWYPKDFRTDAAVIVMTLEQQGAYRNLMDVEWLEGGLPTDPELLWKLAGCRSRMHFDELWGAMCTKFIERDGRFYHPRLDDERKKQRKNRRVKQLAARVRWSKRNARALQMQCLPSSFAPAVLKIPPTPRERGDRPVTRAERKHAEQVRRAWGRCRHMTDPVTLAGVCATYEDCLRRIVAQGRASRATAARTGT